MRPRLFFLAGLVGLAATLASASCAGLTLELASSEGLYQGTLSTPGDAPPIGSGVDWVLELTTRTGQYFVPVQVTVFGGMPAHGHGLPSEPAVTKRLREGAFLVQGLTFNMAGVWRVGFQVAGPLGLDSLGVEFDLQPQGPERSIQSNGSDGLGAQRVASASGPLLWSAAERALIQSLALTGLAAAQDHSNRLLGHRAAIELGRNLFADAKLSRTGQLSCQSCHDPKRHFTDGRARSIGLEPMPRHSPSLVGVAHGDWFYWDGRRDSLWAQALTPIETSGELGGNRTDAVRHLLAEPSYRRLLERIVDEALPELPESRFPPGAGPYADAVGKAAWNRMPMADRELVNHWFALLGKAIAAYETTLDFQPSRFDLFAAALMKESAASAFSAEGSDSPEPQRQPSPLTQQEQRGLKLYVDGSKTQCLRCHNGPRLSNGGFHNVGTGTDAQGNFDFGRMLGLQAVWYDPFRCDGVYSDAPKDGCTHLRFAPKRELPHNLQGAFKVPTLRNVGSTAPYFHDGRFANLEAVVEFYADPGPTDASGHELAPLQLSRPEKSALVAFLKAL